MVERTVASREVYAGRLINVRVDEVELDNGRRATREIVEHPGAVAILALTTNNELVFVRQYRKAAERVTLEIPAGTLGPGEEPAACAARELREETGLGAHTLNKVCSFYTAVGFCTEVLHLFVATEWEPGEQACEEDECIDVVQLPVAQAMQYIHDGTIVDAKTVAGVFWAELYLAGNPQALRLCEAA
ncbi:MAG TPA: NUDIX hydrolase [Chloroflexota bacterium]|nr:NUDIX hydrolase [Chloroflexota bacterium]